MPCSGAVADRRGILVVSRRTLSKYAWAVVIVVLATAVRSAMNPILGERARFIMYIIGVAIASWLGGAGPGLLALGLGAIAAVWFFVPPQGTLSIAQKESVV